MVTNTHTQTTKRNKEQGTRNKEQGTRNKDRDKEREMALQQKRLGQLVGPVCDARCPANVCGRIVAFLDGLKQLVELQLCE